MRDHIKFEPKEIGQKCAERIGLLQDKDRRQAVVNTVMNLRLS